MNDLLTCHITTLDQTHTFTISPELLYLRARTVLPSLLQLNKADRQSMLMKVAVKGLFLSFGEWMLQQIYKSKDHPRPGKQDDLIEWYLDLFTRILLSQGMASELILRGVATNDGSITITEVSTRSATASLPASNAANDGRTAATN